MERGEWIWKVCSTCKGMQLFVLTIQPKKPLLYSWNLLYHSLSTFFFLHPEIVMILILGFSIPMQVFILFRFLNQRGLQCPRHVLEYCFVLWFFSSCYFGGHDCWSVCTKRVLLKLCWLNRRIMLFCSFIYRRGWQTFTVKVHK